jgi:hypothetical protein
MVFIQPRYYPGGVEVQDCSGEWDWAHCLNAAGIGGYVGDDTCEPCDPTATSGSTWSGVKSLFR